MSFWCFSNTARDNFTSDLHWHNRAWVMRHEVVWLIIVSRLRDFSWGAVLRFVKSIWSPLWNNQRGDTPTDRWSCVVCVYFCPHLGEDWIEGGREAKFREEEEVEKSGERSVEAQLVRPLLQPAAASDEPVSSLLACPTSFCPVPPPSPCPAPPQSRSPCRLSPAVPSFLLSSPLCTLTLHLTEMPLKVQCRCFVLWIWWLFI